MPKESASSANSLACKTLMNCVSGERSAIPWRRSFVNTATGPPS